MIFHGMLRVKNEARWIADVIRSIQPLCERVVVLDDHSTDGTADICRALGATVYDSPFQGLDESRDKNWLLSKLWEGIPQVVDPQSPHIAVCIDGDEVLDVGGAHAIRAAVEQGGVAWGLRILYLWDSPRQVRVDGVYANFCRPSLFRLINPAFRFQSTPWGNGANFHCSSIPQEFLGHARPCEARLLHLGYMDRADRLRKYAWYNRIDGGNTAEDCYRHVIQGDMPEVPAGARLKHAGPLELRPL